LDFTLSEEQQAIRDTARAFATDRMAPEAARWDEEKIFPGAVLREAAALGFGGLYCKDDVGGSVLTRLDAAIVFEELAAGFCMPSPPLTPVDSRYSRIIPRSACGRMAITWERSGASRAEGWTSGHSSATRC
jgi:hypothetical protein